MYGPITTIQEAGQVRKKIPWMAFHLKEADWARVVDIKVILDVCLSLYSQLRHVLTAVK
jgi:hypothetical protein